MRVRLEELDESSFHEFGQILATPGKTWRKDFAANLNNRRLTAAPPNLALIRAEAAAFPLTIDELERHEHSSQAFLPLDVREYMVIVCKDNGHGSPDLGTLRGFRISGTVGVNYDCGVWHVGINTIGGSGIFAVLMFQSGDAEDCTFQKISRVVVDA
jgi:ureidoglycolate lyase